MSSGRVFPDFRADRILPAFGIRRISIRPPVRAGFLRYRAPYLRFRANQSNLPPRGIPPSRLPVYFPRYLFAQFTPMRRLLTVGPLFLRRRGTGVGDGAGTMIDGSARDNSAAKISDSVPVEASWRLCRVLASFSK